MEEFSEKDEYEFTEDFFEGAKTFLNAYHETYMTLKSLEEKGLVEHINGKWRLTDEGENKIL